MLTLRRFLPAWCLLCAALALPSPAPAQPANATAAERPRVGLVLSGGGARGITHVGVLKVLEEARVPRQRIRTEEFVASRPSPQTGGTWA